MDLPTKLLNISDAGWYAVVAIAVVVPYVGGFLTALMVRWFLAG